MWRKEGRSVCLGILWLMVGGCAAPPAARYVYQDGEYGVIGIPMNTYMAKPDFRAQAEELMARHFPDGYEIVRAEEVTEGEKILDVGRKTEVDTEPALSALNQMFKIGKLDRTTTFEEKDKLKVRECRIIYKKRAAGTPGTPGQFASVATLSPSLYIDPNEVIRRQEDACAEMLAKANSATKKADDHDVKNASHAQPK